MIYKVEPIVCDYAVYRYHDGKKDLIEIFNVRNHAQLVADILNADADHRLYEFPKREKGTGCTSTHNVLKR